MSTAVGRQDRTSVLKPRGAAAESWKGYREMAEGQQRLEEAGKGTLVSAQPDPPSASVVCLVGVAPGN